jgi:drug/metabolite transporter (DMT)-like permease
MLVPHVPLLARETMIRIKGGYPVTTILFIMMSVCAGVAGQLALKHGMSQLGAQSLNPSTLTSMVGQIVLSPWVLLGLVIYGAGTFFWLMVLSRVDLSFAYPMLSTSYVLVLGTSWLFLGESFGLLRILGVMTILVGVVLISQS